MTVAQSRKGRRPMRVSTMLRKEKDGSLYKDTKIAEVIPGGLAEGKKPSDFPTDQLKMGIEVELEHTKDRATAKEIAMDHLSEDRNYYTKLKKMEKEGADYGTNSKGYKLQGKTEIQGIPVAIENRKGSVREGKNEDGSRWKTKFKYPYGYIEGTKGADGEEIDAYVGPDKSSTKAYIVHQKKENGKYDEDTVMLGFKNKAEAKRAIEKHYDDMKYIGDIVTMGLKKLQETLLGANGKPLTKLSMCGDGLDYFRKNSKKLKEYQDRQRAKQKKASAATAFTSAGAFPSDLLGSTIVKNERPAKKKPKKGDVPTRDDGPVDPKTESVQTNQKSTAVAPAGSVTSPHSSPPIY